MSLAPEAVIRIIGRKVMSADYWQKTVTVDLLLEQITRLAKCLLLSSCLTTQTSRCIQCHHCRADLPAFEGFPVFMKLTIDYNYLAHNVYILSEYFTGSSRYWPDEGLNFMSHRLMPRALNHREITIIFQSNLYPLHGSDDRLRVYPRTYLTECGDQWEVNSNQAIHLIPKNLYTW